MPVEHIDVLLKGTAILAAILTGAFAPSFGSAAKGSAVVWLALMIAYGTAVQWWPGLWARYAYLSTYITVGVAIGIALMVWALIGHGVGRLFRRAPPISDFNQGTTYKGRRIQMRGGYWYVEGDDKPHASVHSATVEIDRLLTEQGTGGA